MSNIRWPVELETKLRKLWAEELTAEQIAAKLGLSVTRNSVLGKLFRLGLLKKRPDGYKTRKPKEPRKTVLVPKISKPSIPILFPQKLRTSVPLGPPKSKFLSVLQLTNSTCRWPIGDPQHSDFHFCGHEPRDSSPYCAYHANKATQPLKKATVSEQKAHIFLRNAA